jgi:predicted cupin superfamily sugar epimerase
MRPHPEGGHYAEVFRSVHRVRVLERDVERAALTTIYFLLAAGEYSRWHRVLSDEVWHYQEGDALELILFDDQGLRRLRLGPVSRETRPSIVVPAGTWQAARSMGAYTLSGCTVGPGFDFADFALATDFPEVAARIAGGGTELTKFL